MCGKCGNREVKQKARLVYDVQSMREGNVFSRVCMYVYVCMYVCPQG